MRSAGILLHISSLPSPYGIGTLGQAAYDFADFLHAAGLHYWQILPIGPTSYGDSPYQSFSTCAGSPYFIDLPLLVQDGLLTQAELDASGLGDDACVDYGKQFSLRLRLLRKAYERGRDRDWRALDAFREENPWVEDYALFMAIKESRNMEPWNTWPDEIRLRRAGAVDTYATVLSESVHFYCYLQFLFFRQWNALRAYVHGLDMEIIGDLPIYVPYDSCDVWAQPEMFQLDADGTPTGVAGCPPDCFSEDGQLWGNPLYRWDRMQQDDFAWWKHRIRAAGRLFDVVRIDHFRGLESYWAVPYGDETARGGKWVKGPDHAFTDMLRRTFPELKLIAEDLGFLTEDVVRLRRDSGYPGMKVLQFAFGGDEPSGYQPHRYERNCICYTGTHDNETLCQWLEHSDEKTLLQAAEYFGVERVTADTILRAGMASVADTFLCQMQDWLGLGDGARMNTPGTLSTDNWSWRMEKDALTPELAARIARMCRLYERKGEA